MKKTVKMWNLIEKMVCFVCKLFTMIFHKEVSVETISLFMQFVKFGIVGVSNTLVSYSIYIVCLLLFQHYNVIKNIDYIIAQIISFILSVLWSFYWNNKMVFVKKEGQKRSIWKTLLKTYVSYSFTGLFLNSILLFLWINIVHISEFIAPIINLLISVPLNFIINKYWAFNG